MREIKIKIEGATTDLTPDDRPSIGVYGLEGTGKTRFACTAPDPIGLLALDKKSKRTFEAVAAQMGKRVVTNKEPFISNAEAREMVTCTDIKRIQGLYTDAVGKVFDLGMKFAEHDQIKTIVVDTGTQLFDWILFSHFGKRTQIKPTSRGAPNQDMIDFINGMRAKYLVIVHRSKEVWKNTGAVDKDGAAIQAPSGKYEAAAYRDIGYFLTMNCEMTAKAKGESAGEKFGIRMVKCQTADGVLLEGQDLGAYGLSGEAITFENLMRTAGLEVEESE